MKNHTTAGMGPCMPAGAAAEKDYICTELQLESVIPGYREENLGKGINTAAMVVTWNADHPDDPIDPAAI